MQIYSKPASQPADRPVVNYLPVNFLTAQISFDENMNSEDYGEQTLTEKERCARENHSEIERRRRNKMTHYINELADMVPQCAGLGRRPDKLTILRMAVSHMKAIRNCEGTSSDSSYRPSFLTDQELKHLVLEAANGFMLVVGCDSGKVLFVADSIYPVLNLTQAECIGHSIYDLVHPEDMNKIKEQLSGLDGTMLNRVLDFKTGTVKKENQQALNRVHMSCRRGFICRMKLGRRATTNLHFNRMRNRRPIFIHNDNQYVVVHCTGYVKNSIPQELEACVDTSTSEIKSLAKERCLICIARLQVSNMTSSSNVNQQEFCVRLNEEGKFTYLDERVHGILGYKPHELLGTCWWECVHSEDQANVRDVFNQVLKLKDQTLCVIYRFRSKSDEWMCVRTSVWSFFNPFSEEFEFVVGSSVCVNFLSSKSPPNTGELCTVNSTADMFAAGYLTTGSTNELQPNVNITAHWLNNSNPVEQQPELYPYPQNLRIPGTSYTTDTVRTADPNSHHSLFAHRDFTTPAASFTPQMTNSVDSDLVNSSQNIILPAQSDWNMHYSANESLSTNSVPSKYNMPTGGVQVQTTNLCNNNNWWAAERTGDANYDRAIISLGERYLPQ
ncbi:Aryl hydrocarbon receptor nuclear translocator [Trichinella pseudospiralis]|uniref:Aryl hydrocarbon receptor nuclear translocator homolog n=3 Tax=Trichinella pseudospiralis TaxID=6337 RepID=A0A0V1E4L7_TRIPS|nr:Aryl hydrocarbon receptor nuclear translocator [Trichinella pseudospiralis]